MENSFRTDFLDVIWYQDSNGNKVSKEITNENHIITNGLVVLDGIPDRFYKVEIDGMYETDIKNSLTSNVMFKVDYDHAKVYFHQELEGQSVNITRYFSKGIIKLSAKRVFTSDDSDVETNQINLQNTFDNEIKNAISQNPASAETVQARTDTVNNVIYDTLQKRLNAEKIIVSNLYPTQPNANQIIYKIVG